MQLNECPTTQFCDFENENICGFTNDPNAKINWVREKGSDFSLSGTGPQYDHTYQTKEGHYMFIFTTVNGKESILTF